MQTAQPRSDREIEELLSTPSAGVIETVRNRKGDYAVLGVGGKMGTSLAMMLRRALDTVGKPATQVYGVSRFSRPEGRQMLESAGIRTIPCDLAEAAEVARLPRVENVFYLAGQIFGTDSAPEATWIQNTVVPAYVAQHYQASAIVVFSTGCVYAFSPTTGNGSVESDALGFAGDYASSCIGRERVFSYYSKFHGTRQVMFRLNYAVELRYGVLVDIATKVLQGAPIDVTTGWLNCIWQGDACGQAIESLRHASSPPCLLNVTGREKLSVRELAAEFGRRLGRSPTLTGQEAATAWLSDSSRATELFGAPATSLAEILELVSAHVLAGGGLLGKPTHFEERQGKF